MPNPNQSHIDVHPGGTSFVGADAVKLFRAISMMSALSFYGKHKMVMTRGLSSTLMLQIAKEFTGKTYRRGQHAQAAEDVRAWVDAMKAAMPITHSGKTVARSELSALKMTTGGENTHPVVILDGRLTEWAGIGWIDDGEASADDRNNYPTVTD